MPVTYYALRTGAGECVVATNSQFMFELIVPKGAFMITDTNVKKFSRDTIHEYLELKASIEGKK